MLVQANRIAESDEMVFVSVDDSFVQSPVSPSTSRAGRVSQSNRTMNTELETSFSDELDMPKHSDHPSGHPSDHRPEYQPNGIRDPRADYRAANQTDYNRADYNRTDYRANTARDRALSSSNSSIEKFPARSTEPRCVLSFIRPTRFYTLQSLLFYIMCPVQYSVLYVVSPEKSEKLAQSEKETNLVSGIFTIQCLLQDRPTNATNLVYRANNNKGVSFPNDILEK